ncbi:hypothetical protein PNK_1073 [Candidatus Protochlamydia naegleriophila]|uniref:Uncharacterized protein n=1 Tax=Candidatus Protochlamydia naegleriophila TaxID=389348 RepID=A0A0U5JDJ9_9BACT|nr:hypothetical protein [Candidatus Protochlamydia naegleriophila]CUI16690.1 hypothetical protein PNK_1073 [Candidatus Protochlamydia naegleriophila]
MTIQGFGAEYYFDNHRVEQQQQQSRLVPVVETVHNVVQPVLTEQEQGAEPSPLRQTGIVLIAGLAGQTTSIALSALSIAGKILPPPYNFLLGGTIVVLAHFTGGVVYHRIHDSLTGTYVNAG